MINQTIKLELPYEKAGIEKKEHVASVVTYIQEPQYQKKPRPAVIICPGGGYEYCSSREAECIAIRYMGEGMQAFVLYYSCAPDVFPTALLELAETTALVRAHAEEWGIDSNRIMVAGFSAGAHLAASLGCFWNQSFVWEPIGRSASDVKPNGNILCYPVITSGEFAHRGSFDHLCAGLPEEYLEKTSLELQVSDQNPPTFLWHTITDQAVPVENSILYLQALRKKQVSVELHLYPQGNHGLSLANEETATCPEGYLPHVQSWFALSTAWVRDLC